MNDEPIWGAPLRTCAYAGEPAQVDVAVIGGGFTGLSAALQLLHARPGLRLVLLEADGLGAGASGRTTGMLTPGVGQNLAALAQRLGPDGARTLYQASLEAVAAARALIEEEGIACELTMGGQLILAHGPGGRGRLGALAELMEGLELPVERLDDAARAAAIALAPAADPPPGTGPAALRLPDAGTLHPLRLLEGLARRVEELGGQVFTDSPVTGLDDGRVHTAAGTLEAEQVVVALAGFAPRLGVHRGRLLPVELQVLVSEPLDPPQRERLGWTRREGVIDSRRLFNYFRLTSDERIVFGGGRPRYGWSGRSAGAPDLRALAAEYRRTIPDAPPLAAGWAGLIGYVVDGLPVVGRLPDRPRVLHVGGWCGHGVALSLASGAWVTALLGEDAAPDDPRFALPWFRPHPPLVPWELARWLGFRGSVALMALGDRFR